MIGSGIPSIHSSIPRPNPITGSPQLMSASKRRHAAGVPYGNLKVDLLLLSLCSAGGRANLPFPARAFRKSPCLQRPCFQAAPALSRPSVAVASAWVGRPARVRPREFARAQRRVRERTTVSLPPWACEAPLPAAGPFRPVSYPRQRWPRDLSAAPQLAGQDALPGGRPRRSGRAAVPD